MASIAIDTTTQFRINEPETPASAGQSAEKKRSWFSGCQMASVRQEIFRRWIQGRTERALCITYEVTREGIEDALRDRAKALLSRLRTAEADVIRLAREVQDLRLALAQAQRAGAVVAMALVGIFAAGAWQPVGPQETAWRAPRSNRGRRGRRRGLDDGYRPAEIRWAATAGGAA